jgi:arabinofuranosyltransferase
LLIGLLVVMLVVSTHFLWRYHFYGQWLPNTYYLKLTGWPLSNRIVVGIKQTLWTAAQLGIPSLFAAIAIIPRPKRRHFLLLGILIIAVLYQIYLGGDAWPLSRFVIPYSLGLFVLAAEGIHRLITLLMERKTGLLRMIVRNGLVFTCIVAINAIHWDHFVLLARPQTTGCNRTNIRCVHAVEKIASPDASVAIVSAGGFPYFSQRVCVDLLGKCDRHIARLPANPQIHRAGHNKIDLTYSISTYKPDIIVHMVDRGNSLFRKQYEPVLTEVDGVKMVFCARIDSCKIRECKTVSWSTLIDYVVKAREESNKRF